jgi:integrase
MLTMEMKLEEGCVAKIQVPEGKRDVMVFDTEQPGFFVRKFSTGRAVYGCKFSVNGAPRKVTLYDATIKGMLAKARKAAGDVRAKARLGTDVLAEREAAKAAKAAEERKAENTLAVVVKKYLDGRESEMRPRYFLEVKRHLEKHFKPLHSRPIEDITKPDIVAVLNDLERDSGKVAADHALSALGTFYVWAIDNNVVNGTPVAHVKRRAKPVRRKRSLSEAELREVWLATDAADDEGKRLVAEDYARIIKLLASTGQRKGEIGGLDWAEIIEGGGHGDRIELPETRTKNHLPHMVPLSAQAMALLPPRPDRHDPMARTMVFGRRAHTGFSGWSKAKAELDAAILVARRKVNPKAKPMEPWVVHDLRRTTATLLRELNLADTHLVELILNHISGTRGGVAGVYDKSERMADRRKALEAWGRYVEELVR